MARQDKVSQYKQTEEWDEEGWSQGDVRQPLKKQDARGLVETFPCGNA